MENQSSEGDLRGLVGLQNLGNTCYMNGALQALSNCRKLTRYFLNSPEFPIEKGLCRSYSELIREIWGSNDSQYAVPTSIIRNIKCIYPAFRGCTQQDTQEFLRCFLEQLHDELKEPDRKQVAKVKEEQSSEESDLNEDEEEEDGLELRNKIKFEEDGDEEKKEMEDEAKVAAEQNEARDDVQQEHKDESKYEEDRLDVNELKEHKDGALKSDGNNSKKTIISDTFEFKISSSVVCSSCNSISTTQETFKDLSIPIQYRDNIIEDKDEEEEYNEEDDDDDDSDASDDNTSRSYYTDSIPLARWFWNWLSYLSNWFWGPQITLQDCLSIFFGTDPLEGDNEYSCDVCTKKNRGVKYLKILELPEVLCIHFKRYESIGSSKITTHVSFPLTGLDLAPFMSEESKPQSTTYDLIACICHHGSALLNGHYTTYALNCYDDQWYEFDDQYVTNVQSYQVENSEAYILFYQRSNTDKKD